MGGCEGVSNRFSQKRVVKRFLTPSHSASTGEERWQAFRVAFPETFNYTLDVEIFDHFGVDDADVNRKSGGLGVGIGATMGAFFVLQHNRNEGGDNRRLGKYRPCRVTMRTNIGTHRAGSFACHRQLGAGVLPADPARACFCLGAQTMTHLTPFDLAHLAPELSRTDPAGFEEAGRVAALELFHEAAQRIPAYRQFLASRGVDHASVRTYEDFRCVPATTRADYVDEYPLEELVWDGDLSCAVVLNSSSGTTGASAYWPNSSEEMEDSARLYEYLYCSWFDLPARRTLLVICFGMGTWIAGSYTFLASQAVSRRGYPLTVITPGFDKAEALRCLTRLAPKFDQVIVAGIPSFVKDLADAWAAAGSARPRWTCLLLAGEGFSEPWRRHVVETAGASAAVSLLGSADAGLMAFETPATQRLRLRAEGDRILQTHLFGRPRLPAVFAYLPTERFFEEENGELLITARRGLPLIRYDLHDEGGILPGSLAEDDWGGGLPLVYVFGRGQFGTSFYGLTIYPEDVQSMLLHDIVSARVSGRFILESGDGPNHDPYLQIHVELAEGMDPEPLLRGMLADLFVADTRRARGEYDRICQEYGPKAHPQVVLHHYGDATVFPRSVQKKTS
jgi:phenylacetate-CoA ligase